MKKRPAVKAAKAYQGKRNPVRARIVRESAIAEAILPHRIRALSSLRLPLDYVPSTFIQKQLEVADVDDPYYYLSHSQEESARKLVRLWLGLAQVERKAVTFDDLIAAAGVDWADIYGELSKQVCKISGLATNMLAAIKSPEVMDAVIKFGKAFPLNHGDRKLVLQTSGVAPVPKNQVTNVTIRDSQLNANRTLNVSVPSLEDVVKDMDAIVGQVVAKDKPSSVPSE